MEDYEIEVDVIMEDDSEQEVTVCIDPQILLECDGIEEQMEYIENKAKKQNDGVKEIDIMDSRVEDIVSDIEDMLDPSDMIPNETLDDFFDHEDDD